MPKNKQAKTEQQLAQDFINQYEGLCKKSGFQLVVTPTYRRSDDGTWSTFLQTSVGKLSSTQ